MSTTPNYGVRSDSTERLLRIQAVITWVRQRNGKSVDVPGLSDTCGCSIPTIDRELRHMEQEGLLEKVSRGCYRLTPQSRSLPMAVPTVEEALLLGIARAYLDRADVPLRREIQTVLGALTTALPSRIRRIFEDAASVLSVQAVGDSLSDDVPLPRLIDATGKQQTLEMDYTSQETGRSRRHIDPYEIAVEGTRVHLHGWCHNRRDFRTFSLRSIHDVTPTGATFERDEEGWTIFKKREGVFLGLRGGDLIPVRVRFDATVAEHVCQENRWPSGFRTERSEDGTVLLTGQASGTEGIVPTLLYWHRHAQVEGGPELLAAMREEVAALHAYYEKSPENSSDIAATYHRDDRNGPVQSMQTRENNPKQARRRNND